MATLTTYLRREQQRELEKTLCEKEIVKSRFKDFLSKDYQKTKDDLVAVKETIKDIANIWYRSIFYKIEKEYEIWEDIFVENGLEYIKTTTVPIYKSKKRF